MLEQPPVELVATLERLGLATAGQVLQVARRVRRLARDLPQFESVWIDALAQARVLTPFQAAELNAGRAEALRVGPYVLAERLAHPYYVACYRARHAETGQWVRLAVWDEAGTPVAGGKVASGQWPVASCPPHPTLHSLLSTPSLAPIIDSGLDGGRLFAAAAWIEGRTAAEWIVHHGRFPPAVVLEIARAMLVGSAELERAGICHGDVNAASLILTDTGDVVLAMPGLRPIVRLEEPDVGPKGSVPDLPPEAFETLAPERVAAGTPANMASDIFACGCLWWQLLCGRPALSGGDCSAKIRAAQAAAVPDVRRFAADVPATLAAAISACLEREPERRPESIARLAAMLGPPTCDGKEALADCLARTGRPTVPWPTTYRAIRKSNRTPLWSAVVVCGLAVIVAGIWPLMKGRGQGSGGGGQGMKVLAKGEGGRGKGVRNGQWPVVSGRKLATGGHDSAAGVVAATYQQVETRPADVVLSAGKPVEAATIAPRAGQRVRAAAGGRAVVDVSGKGFVVSHERVRFENIDFVAARSADAADGPSAIIELRAGWADFHGCTFRVADSSASPPAAVLWRHPARIDETGTSLPSGRLLFVDCVMRGTRAGIECRTAGALGIELESTLHVEAGPLVRLDHCPRPDEPVSLLLSQCTLRGGGPLVECLVPHLETRPGTMTVRATACAFAPEAGTPLLRFIGNQLPDRLAASVRWTGQGSLVVPGSPILAWRTRDGRERALDESELSIAGLVRSEVGFAGEASDDPAASRLVRWNAPVQTGDTPGIDLGGEGRGTGDEGSGRHDR